MRKPGTSRRPVMSACPSVRHTRVLYPNGQRFLGLQHRHSSFMRLPGVTRNPSAGVLNTGKWENLLLSTVIAVFLSEAVRDRPMVATKRKKS